MVQFSIKNQSTQNFKRKKRVFGLAGAGGATEFFAYYT